MAYCSKCGKELAEGAKYCPACGSSVGAPSGYRPEPEYEPYEREEPGTAAWGILSFILTIFTAIGGLILCLVLYGSGKPKSGAAALIGFIMAFVVGIIAVVAFVVILAASAPTTEILSQMIC